MLIIISLLVLMSKTKISISATAKMLSHDLGCSKTVLCLPS